MFLPCSKKACVCGELDDCGLVHNVLARVEMKGNSNCIPLNTTAKPKWADDDWSIGQGRTIVCEDVNAETSDGRSYNLIGQESL